MNPLEQSVQYALEANEIIRGYFGEVGTHDRPRGKVFAAYRNARRAMRQALAEKQRVRAAGEVLEQLRITVRHYADMIIGEAQEFGATAAETQLAFYGVIALRGALPDSLKEKRTAAVGAVIAKLNAQIAAITAMIEVGGLDEMIVGEGETVGVLRPGETIVTAAYWLTQLSWDSFDWFVQKNGGGQFQKQAIAGLDERTTDCCLRVHGQIRDLDAPFSLVGTPQFAAEVDHPPFHHYCRTAVALYQSQYDGGVTDRMRAGADNILAERKRGQRTTRHPADAYG